MILPKINILLIEDNLNDVVFIKRALKQTNKYYSVNTVEYAKNLTEGISLLNGKKKDTILLDMNLPDGKGIPLLKQIIKKAPQTPVVVLTGDNDPEIAMAALEEGAMDYIIKDEISGDLLSRTLRFALERYSKLREPANIIEKIDNDKKQQGGVEFYESNLFIKIGTVNGNEYVNLALSDIHFFKATGDYVVIQSTSGKYITHCTMATMESKLSPSKFIRVHRSYIINIAMINKIQENVLFIDGEEIPIGKTYKQAFMNRINKV